MSGTQLGSLKKKMGLKGTVARGTLIKRMNEMNTKGKFIDDWNRTMTPVRNQIRGIGTTLGERIGNGLIRGAQAVQTTGRAVTRGLTGGGIAGARKMSTCKLCGATHMKGKHTTS